MQWNQSMQISVFHQISKCQKLLLNKNPVPTKYCSASQASQHKSSSLSVYQAPRADEEETTGRVYKEHSWS